METPQQIEQLSALISGAMYLRQECQRKDIPDESILMQTAVKLAMERNWDTKAPAYQALKGKSQARYQALVEEIGTDNNQCSSLNLLLADFAYEARRNIK
ncbi:type II secretion system pilot lipoprotein GspS [Yersinia sp. J1]|uniref:type II secretion system pilot lipoprotein GspS n=1 Tax=Yersinia sp. J1 TaxID=3424774 RepID=UPI003D35B700